MINNNTYYYVDDYDKLSLSSSNYDIISSKF